MPKVIEGLEEKLIKTAEELFMEEGYDAVNIRRIAKASGVAVGTVYNYFSSKDELYLEVLKDSWDKTMEVLSQILLETSDLDDKLMKFIKTMYIEVENRKGLGGRMILEERKKKSDSGTNTEEELNRYMDRVEDMFLELLKHHEGIKNTIGDPERLATVIIGSQWMLHRGHNGESEKNLKFIENYMKCLLG